MALKTILVDDEQLARDELAYLLKGNDDIEIVATAKNGVEAVKLITEHSPDLVFLDVQMPGLDGFGVIKKLLDKKSGLPQFIFATAFDQYAVKAFEVSAADYLLKPFDKKRVQAAVEKAKRKSKSNASSDQRLDDIVKLLEERQNAAAKPVTKGHKKVLLRAAGRMILIDQREICYATIEEGIITIFTSTIEGQANCRTLEELQESLDANLFWRAHRGYVVNINRIREVVPWFKSSYQLRMDDKRQSEVPVSRAQTKRLRELFGL